MDPIEILPLAEPGGAEVRCGRIQDIERQAFPRIYQAWLEHLVLVFHNQRISDFEFGEFARRFGPLKSAAIDGAGQAPQDQLEIHVVSNVVENGIPIGILGNGDVVWHTDMASFLEPPSASLLYAVETPEAGGDTYFMNMYLAYETLPLDVKRRIVNLTIKHEVMEGSSGSGTGASHPIVRTHPEAGCNALYLGTREHTFINGLSRPESERLLDFLWAHIIQRQFIWRHSWRPGDVVVWDNRAVMHGRAGFAPNMRRILHRTQVQGSRPSTAPDALQRPPHSRGAPGAPLEKRLP